ncbi:hypothetical protein DV515_00010135 [Chloebia gouldiae]|uniref:Uncharacterized protein n=1 Tax=Chloebia gouldiae TaxID=44316 RepID=A0A3L8SAV0_CHLGU|nr:hypothetical protein DV515_00010135 [Chloebia gouldiae]
MKKMVLEQLKKPSHCLKMPWKMVMMMQQKLLDLEMLLFLSRMNRKSFGSLEKVTETRIPRQTGFPETGPLRLRDPHPLLLKIQAMTTLKS